MPPPRTAGPAHGATAPHVAWAVPDAPVTRPHAVLVDRPGGPLDRIAADADVATFLNDRFHAWFVPAAGPPRTLFLSPAGCLLAEPVEAKRPADWIEAANTAAIAASQGHRGARPALPPMPGLPADHPLHRPCP